MPKDSIENLSEKSPYEAQKTIEGLAKNNPLYRNVGEIKYKNFRASGVYVQGVIITVAHAVPHIYEKNYLFDEDELTFSMSDDNGNKDTIKVRKVYNHPLSTSYHKTAYHPTNDISVMVLDRQPKLVLESKLEIDFSPSLFKENSECVGFTPLTAGVAELRVLPVRLV